MTVGPEIIAYCQFTDLHDNLIRGANRVRREISKTVIDRSKLAEFIIPRNNFVETLEKFDCSGEMNNCYD